MNVNNSLDANIRYSSLQNNIQEKSPAVRAENQAAKAAAGNLTSAENALVSAIKNGDETKIQLANIAYQKAQRIYAVFVETMKAGHDMLMNLIRKLTQ